MAEQITCERGTVIRVTIDDEAIEGAREGLRSEHPELGAKVSRDHLLGWIEEA